MADKTLTEMARGGMYDHIGGGFHRYSTDREWFVPHFEKMLYDQAILSKSYLEAYQATGHEDFARVAREIFDYVLRDMQSLEGGFYSAEDADSFPPEAVEPTKKSEGAFYLWYEADLIHHLGTEDAKIFNYYFGVESHGNVENDPHREFSGKNILFAAHTLGETAQKFGKSEGEIRKIITDARNKLLEIRSKRPRPHLDDKILTDWNGLMISSMAYGGAVLDERSRIRGGTFVVALEALAEGAKVKVTDAAIVDADWILEAFPEDLSEERELRYDAGRRRVEAVERLKVRELVLDESKREADPALPRVAEVLAEAALGEPVPESWIALLHRLAFLRSRRPELGLPEDLRRPLLVSACAGHSRLGAALEQDPAWLIGPAFGEAVAQALPKVAPTHAALLKRRLQVNYDGERPWIESRLQDFLGLKEGPAVDEGRLPLVLHLLAPNYRAVQVTTDLAGFWQRVYPELKKQLSRRYPKHEWR